MPAISSESTPETTAEQAQPAADSSPTTTEAPAKGKKPTAAETRKLLEDLQPVAAARMVRIRELEVEKQRAKTVLKQTGTPGMTLQQDHYRISEQLKEVRKILGVVLDEVSGG